MSRSDPLADPEPLIKRVYSFVAYRIGGGPDAQDVTSETFERALRGRDTYDPARGSPVAWLLGIARRALADALAARAAGYGEVPAGAVGTAEMEEGVVRRLTLSAAIATLEERDQELIALRYGADLSARRIAQILDMRTNTVEVALHRALGRLREALGGDGLAETRGSNAETFSRPL
jgi:RNA polymerase sigma factor (sigma-70 family)